MKKISRLAALFVLVASFSAPILASAACTPPLVEDNGQCYSVANGVYTRVDSTSGIPVGTVAPSTSAGSVNSTYLDFYYNLILTTVNSYLIPILIAISFIVFLWGVYKYFIYGADDEAERKTGRSFILWGIIGFVIIVSVWALVNVVSSTIIPTGVSNRPTYPTL